MGGIWERRDGSLVWQAAREFAIEPRHGLRFCFSTAKRVHIKPQREFHPGLCCPVLPFCDQALPQLGFLGRQIVPFRSVGRNAIKLPRPPILTHQLPVLPASCGVALVLPEQRFGVKGSVFACHQRQQRFAPFARRNDPNGISVTGGRRRLRTPPRFACVCNAPQSFLTDPLRRRVSPRHALTPRRDSAPHRVYIFSLMYSPPLRNEPCQYPAR